MITDQDVRDYVARCAESIIEDDLNEGGDWSDEDFRDLQDRAYDLLSDLESGVAINEAD